MTSGDTSSVDALMMHWRHRVSSTVLGTMAVVSTLMTLMFAPAITTLLITTGLVIAGFLGVLAAHPRATVAAKGRGGPGAPRSRWWPSAWW